MEIARRLVRRCDKVLNIAAGLLLILMLLYAGYALWDTWQIYHGAGLSDEIERYKPDGKDPGNPSLEELQAINPDVCAWVTVDDTGIDYPVLQGEDNSEYLNKDIYGEYALGGSIFMDYRNRVDFSDSYSLLYGHHMEGGAMFGDITRFGGEEYFDAHRTGHLYIPGKTYGLEIFAYLHVDAYKSVIFQVEEANGSYGDFLEYIREEAERYRDADVTEKDRIIALSTCSSAETNGRGIVVAKLTEENAVTGEEP